jgi:hypothetical protein
VRWGKEEEKGGRDGISSVAEGRDCGAFRLFIVVEASLVGHSHSRCQAVRAYGSVPFRAARVHDAGFSSHFRALLAHLSRGCYLFPTAVTGILVSRVALTVHPLGLLLCMCVCVFSLHLFV